jgi:hypothetical protein
MVDSDDGERFILETSGLVVGIDCTDNQLSEEGRCRNENQGYENLGSADEEVGADFEVIG